MKRSLAVLLVFAFAAVSYGHLCDNVFRQADKLIVKPETYNIVVKDQTTFKIFLQNNMDRGIAEISLLASSPAFDFSVSPQKMTIPKDQRAYFEVTMSPKASTKTGNYSIDFKLVGGGREFKSFSMKTGEGETPAPQPAQPVKPQEPVKAPAKSPPSKILTVKTSPAGPKCDGVLDDPCWKSAALCSNFSSSSGGKAVSRTVALINCDGKNMNFGIYCGEDAMNKLSYNDSVEIRLSPDKSGYPFYSFLIPAVGTPTIKKTTAGSQTVLIKIPGMACTTGRGTNSWNTELSIPLSAIQAAGSNNTWQLRITRTKVAGKTEISYWSADSSGYNSEKGFGEFTIQQNNQ